MRKLASVAMLCALVCACDDKLEGPAPQLGSDGKTGVEPAVVCNEQRATEVTLRGDGFSPIAIDVPAHPRIELPTVTLSRAVDLDGRPATDVQVVYAGDPRGGVNAPLLGWKSQKEMVLTVNQAVTVGGKSGPIPTGVYDVGVRNPNGNSVETPGALVVAPPPAIGSSSTWPRTS